MKFFERHLMFFVILICFGILLLCMWIAYKTGVNPQPDGLQEYTVKAVMYKEPDTCVVKFKEIPGNWIMPRRCEAGETVMILWKDKKAFVQ